MKNFFNNILTEGAHIRQRAQKAWRTFLFTPAHYWKSALIVFGVIFLIILLVDAWLFWRFANAPQDIPDQFTSEPVALRLKELDSVLKLLREREMELLQTGQTPPPREIFSIPSTLSQ